MDNLFNNELIMKNCKICNKKFKDNTNNHIKIYCSKNCKKIRNLKAKRLLPDEIKKNCKICNQFFIDKSYAKHKKYCSPKCRNVFKMNNPARKLFNQRYIESGRKSLVNKKYSKTPKGKKNKNHNTAMRHARKLRAIPLWANIEKIKEIYRNRKKGYHVDHVVPLKGLNVCGLHVENNLQYLTVRENISKGNKLIYDR